VVYKEGQLQGILGLDSISRYFLIQTALWEEGIPSGKNSVITV
jgi:hypothetical protein